MCLIIDINIAHRVLLTSTDPDFGIVHRRLFLDVRNPLKIVYGGKLLEEYHGNNAVMRQVLQLDRAGKARLIHHDSIEKEVTALVANASCRSDDEHIIALARCSTARVLCSADANLHTDFTDAALINGPRGKVYKRPAHAHLLRDPCP